MRKTILAASAALLLAAAGCDPAHNYVTWDTGLHVKGSATEKVVSRSFKAQEGLDTVESKGTLDSGTFAGDPSGYRTSTEETTTAEEWTVVGDTWTENPLVPGEPTFSDVPVAIVEKVAVKNGTKAVEDMTVTEPNQGQKRETTTYTNQVIDRETTASTLGMAGDEYVVAISNLNLLWDPDLVEKWHDTRTPLPGLDYLVRANVAVGDFWVSPDGTTLYKAVARESVDVGGGRRVAATKVEMRKAEGVANDDLVGRCLFVPADGQGDYTDVSGISYTEQRKVHLNPGCEGKFAHYRTGYQWWSDNVLVAEDSTTFTVAIEDYGYEWMEFNNGKARRTAKELDVSRLPADAYLFVQYTYTETNRKWRVEQLNKAATPWSK